MVVPLNRNQLASFLKDNETIIRFQQLFQTVEAISPAAITALEVRVATLEGEMAVAQAQIVVLQAQVATLETLVEENEFMMQGVETY